MIKNKEEILKGLEVGELKAIQQSIPYNRACDGLEFYYGVEPFTHRPVYNNKVNMFNTTFMVGSPDVDHMPIIKREILNVLIHTNDDVVVLDTRGEYNKLAKEYGGEIINITPESVFYINPMNISKYTYYDSPMLSIYEMLIPLFESIMNKSLHPIQKSIIDKCLIEVYEKDIELIDLPTLFELHEAISKKTEDEAKELADALNSFMSKTGDIFSNKTSLTTNSRLVVYNISGFPEEVSEAVALIMFSFMWNNMADKKALKKTWIYNNVFDILSETSVKYYRNISKPTRVNNGVLTTITQDIEKTLNSEYGRSMFCNSNSHIVLRQTLDNSKAISEIYELFQDKSAYLNDGKAILVTDDRVVPFCIDVETAYERLYNVK